MIEYPMPGQVPDLFKGFREELANIDKVERQEQQRALKMASMIEQADQSTMFGGDYSEAQEMAQWMTDHIDDFADSTEGMIEFQQMAQQLNSFIDASEAYKKQNVGTAAGGAAQGTWTGSVQRIAGVDPYEAKGFRDTRTKEDYEMAYMSLNQGRKLQFDEQGRPMLSQRGRVESPFMPQLEEIPLESGFEWMEKNAKGHRFPDGATDAEAWIRAKAEDQKLLRQIVKQWKETGGSGNPASVDALMNDPKNQSFVESAVDAFVADAMRSFNMHAGDPKPEKVDEDQTLLGRFEKLTIGEFTTDDMPGISAEATEGIPPIGPGIPTMEMPQPALDTGFDAFYELAKPISTLSLGEGKKIVGFNVDAFSNMYIVVRQPAQASGDPNAVLDEETGMEMVTMKVEAGSPLQKTLKRYIDDDIVSALMNLSKSRTQERTQQDISSERGKQAGAIAGRAASAEKGGLFSRFFGLR